MKIQIALDLHLEFKENKVWADNNPLIPKADILILAGDIVVDRYKKKAKEFYDKISKDFKFIISTMGNHEFYLGEVDYAYPSYKKYLAENHIKLNNKVEFFEGVKFIVSILWSNVPDKDVSEVETLMNDYKLIYKQDSFYAKDKTPITTKITNKYHKISLDFIESELKKPFDGKIVIVTHHLPSYKCVEEFHKYSTINSGYANHLDKLIEDNPKIALWIHGHSHNFLDITIGKTRVIRNPLGYIENKEGEDFKRDFVVEI